MKIVPYNPKYKAAFIAMNEEWISTMFALEEQDRIVLQNIEQKIEKGAEIFFALDECDAVMACCMISPFEGGDEGEWEIEKFCARGMYTGSGAGYACLKACIDYAKRIGVRKISIGTSTKCQAAVHLYRKAGFAEVPYSIEKYHFDRGNLAFEMIL